VGLVALSGCIEDRLSVDMSTRVLADGSCQRRIEYRLERVDADQNKRLRIPPAESPLRTLHHFPQGDGWQLREDLDGDVHVVLVEGTLPSPNDLEGDYSRTAIPKGRPALNHVSFAAERGAYDYSETLVDPASPLAAARLLSQSLLKRQDDFAERLERALGDPQVRRADLKRAFQNTFAQPFAKEVATLFERPTYGPRERQRVDELMDELTAHQANLVTALVALVPGRDRKDMDDLLDHTFEDWGDSLSKDLEAAGLPLPTAEHSAKVHFRATLTLPAPIVRANTCFAGDTATWDFEGDDLYGRGFDMWARAVQR
jgi:hypothetical protein